MQKMFWDNIPDLVTWEKDRESMYLRANNNCAKLFGFKKADQMPGLNDYQLNCEFSDLAPIFQDCDKKVIKTAKPLKLMEILKNEKEGKWIIFLVNKVATFDQNKAVVGTFGHAMDVTAPFIRMGAFLARGESKQSHSIINLKQDSFSIHQDFSEFNLTRRQADCLFFLIRGRNNKEIARLLNLSPRTVEAYIDNIKDKYCCHTKAELIDKALENGFLNIIPSGIFELQQSILV